VNNYAESEQGNLNLLEATAQSSNTAYAQLMVDLGPEKVLAMATKLGMPEFDALQCPTMVLGTENASVLNMAGVYSVFANRGLRKTPGIITRVERVGDEGEVTPLYTRPVEQGERVLTEQQADLVTHTLQGVIKEGTGTGADIGRPAAGKTGTSQENKDAWFVGYVPKLTAAVWMGYPNTWVNPRTGVEEIPPMNDDGMAVHGRSATGGSFPADIWRTFMQSVTDARGMNDPFMEVPEEVIESGTRLGTEQRDETSTTLPPQQGGPPTSDRPGNGPRPTRPGGNTTTTSPSSSTTATSTSSSSTSSSSTTTTSPLPTVTRPGGGGGNG
jgi:membrane peptidoglycan carboxypeptidase